MSSSSHLIIIQWAFSFILLIVFPSWQSFARESNHSVVLLKMDLFSKTIKRGCYSTAFGDNKSVCCVRGCMIIISINPLRLPSVSGNRGSWIRPVNDSWRFGGRQMYWPGMMMSLMRERMTRWWRRRRSRDRKEGRHATHVVNDRG